MSREKIKQAALELFRRYSYVKTSVSDIATASGIGKGTVYLSFKTKEEILFAILDDAIQAKKVQISPELFDPNKDLDGKLSLFSQDILDLHFQIRDLMFGSFENVEGKELQDVYLKFANYIDMAAGYLAEVVGPHGYPPSPQRLAAIREWVLFLSGRIVIYILSHDWNSRQDIHLLIPGWSRSLFHALVPKE